MLGTVILVAVVVTPLSLAIAIMSLPGKPVVNNFGLLWLKTGLLQGIVAHHFWPPGFPGRAN